MTKPRRSKKRRFGDLRRDGEARRLQRYRSKGTIIAIGGKEDTSGDQEILKEFVRVAGGNRARILVMTAATEHPGESARDYKHIFKKLGVRSVDSLDVNDRMDAMEESNVSLLDDITGVWFTGGDQLFITSLIGGTLMHDALVELLERQGVLAGTSAGASMLSDSMIIGGGSEISPTLGGTEIGPGMNFIPGVIIDVHFSQRGRHGRLLTAVAHSPQDLGIGIDEDTALVLEKGIFRVIGSGAVTVIDAAHATMTNLPGLQEGANLALHDVTLHLLPKGYRYDLRLRLPISELVRMEQEVNVASPGSRSGKPHSRRSRAVRRS